MTVSRLSAMNTIESETCPFTLVLSDEETRSLETVDVYVSDIEPKETGRAIKFIRTKCPSSKDLEHAKSIKRMPLNDGGFTLTIILCPTSLITFQDLEALIRSNGLDKVLSPRTEKISKYPPYTKAQFEEWRRLWPLNFRENPKSVINLNKKDIEKYNGYMNKAIELAAEAKIKGEEPIGCLIIDPNNDTIFAESHDTRVETSHPLRHALLNCINHIGDREKSLNAKNSEDQEYFAPLPQKRKVEEIKYEENNFQESNIKINKSKAPASVYLCKGYDVFLTHEPCIMCSMALVHSRISRVFYGKISPNSGGLGSLYKLHTHTVLNHHFQIVEYDLKEILFEAIKPNITRCETLYTKNT
ncbi:hypothetical protein G9A89_013310 [Geosiphon pyriformis]|nr:hypothetical protein G9A89_013310 [Geosiphon pyriformis]